MHRLRNMILGTLACVALAGRRAARGTGAVRRLCHQSREARIAAPISRPSAAVAIVVRRWFQPVQGTA